jgi:hypothetical protein
MKNNLMSIMSAMLIFMSIIISCNTNTNITGKSFSINDSYHTIKFTTSNSYEIYQFTSGGKSCLGEGTWSYNNGIVTLTRNDSRCESTSGIYGQFKISGSGKWLEK